LKAQEYLGVFLEYLTFYEYEGKARVKGYIPELPENYYWSLSISGSVKEPDDRGYYGPAYYTYEPFSPEQALPNQGYTYDKPLFTNKENLTVLVIVCEIRTPKESSGSRFWISLTKEEFSMSDKYGGFSGRYPFDPRGFFEW
ncbi:MAG: S-layer homology domain-containing protein, partial [Thermoclostridium sp.]|nr:S-layer homology domain-containing protein [Thermoclostridium sp.]